MASSSLQCDCYALQNKVEIYHGDLNNSDDLQTPLQLLRLARATDAPAVRR